MFSQKISYSETENQNFILFIRSVLPRSIFVGFIGLHCSYRYGTDLYGLDFPRNPNELYDPKENKDKNCSMVKYGETFYGLHMELKASLIKSTHDENMPI